MMRPVDMSRHPARAQGRACRQRRRPARRTLSAWRLAWAVACSAALPGCAEPQTARGGRASSPAQPTPAATDDAATIVLAALASASAQPAAPGAPAAPEAAACEAGDAKACTALAFRCRLGATDPDVPWESAACAERERKACDAGDAPSCKQLADRYLDSSGHAGVPQDEGRAVELYQRACDSGRDLGSCMTVAMAYETGRGVAQDPAQAARALELTCLQDSGVLPQACTHLASYLANGRGVARDEARAARLYLAACVEGVCEGDALRRLCADASGRRGTNAGCVALAQLAAVRVAGVPPQNGRLALSLLERACQRGEADGCSTLADWYADGVPELGGISVPKDPKRAAALLAKACQAGAASACRAKQ